MPLTPRQRKARFVAAVVENNTTCAAAARDVIGVTWHHLNEGLLGVRPLSDEVKNKVATYVGLPVTRMFPKNEQRAVAV